MTSEQPDTSRATRRRPAWAIGSIAAAVLLAGGGTAYWASTAYGDASRGGGRTEDTAAVAPREAGTPTRPGIAPGEPDPHGGGVTYRADGPLPAAPASAPSFAASGEVTSEEVARLAQALGISGAPRLSGEQWLAGEAADGAGPRLSVTRKAPGTWSFSRFQAGPGDDCVRGKDTCGPATLPEQQAAPRDPGSAAPVSEETAKAAAAPVLAAAGQDGAKVDARLTTGSVRVVVADPVVGGLPTQGWSTRITVGAEGRPVAGSGELKAPVRAAEQPVVGAAEALDRLNASAKGGGDGTGPGPSGCATSVPLTPDTPTGATDTLPCNPEPRPMKPPRTESVKGAVLGLAPGTVDGGRGLVPAWLFEVAGTDGKPGRTVVQPAARDDGGSTAPVPPQGHTVPGFSYAQDDRTLTVNFWGGVCSTYALEAREEAGSVLVKITDTPNKPGQACVMLAKEMSVTARLTQPLGERKVVDATTGKALPRQ
ncbi:membrane protein [Streptomyces polychromogenes]|uniref:Membrane protein n=1 Tax=Streptomyces polychromogenes TaxID=67342 RepID=A0ABN0V5N8_9ACTN